MSNLNDMLMFENDLLVISFRKNEENYIVMNKVDGSYRSYSQPESILENHSNAMNKQDRELLENLCSQHQDCFICEEEFSNQLKQITDAICKKGHIGCKRI